MKTKLFVLSLLLGTTLSISTVSARKIKPVSLSVETVKSSYTYVNGKSTAGSKVQIKHGKAIIGKGTTNKKGTFSIKVKPLAKNWKLSVSSSKSMFKTANKNLVVKYAAIKSMDFIHVSTLTEGSKKITGVFSNNAQITAKTGRKVLGTGKVSKNGSFTIKVAQLKANQTITLSAFKNGYKPISYNLITKLPQPSFHVLNATGTYNPNTQGAVGPVQVKGQTISNATITIKEMTTIGWTADGHEIKPTEKSVTSFKSNANGTFSHKINAYSKLNNFFIEVSKNGYKTYNRPLGIVWSQIPLKKLNFKIDHIDGDGSYDGQYTIYGTATPESKLQFTYTHSFGSTFYNYTKVISLNVPKDGLFTIKTYLDGNDGSWDYVQFDESLDGYLNLHKQFTLTQLNIPVYPES